MDQNSRQETQHRTGRHTPPPGQLLAPGRNCWRVVRADRLGFLIDGKAYFDAVSEAFERAQRSIIIVGWDIDSRVKLRPDRSGRGSAKLSSMIRAVTRRRPELQVYILAWDHSMIYVQEREPLTRVKLGWFMPKSVHFELDGDLPLGASHHQKIVVVDDTLAFTGGFDLTNSRWDTPAHDPHDDRRRTPDGAAYPPFHDVQVALTGEAAGALAELARLRWLRAGGTAIPPSAGVVRPLWPRGVGVELEDARVGIARTAADWGDQDEVREVEQLHVDSVRAAQRYIYVENQFLTSARIGSELAQALERPDGPEVVIVGPQDAPGLLERATMGRERSRVVARLRQADRHGRLRMLYPVVADGGDEIALLVHSKVMIADDRFMRVGSANLTNRSMGLDSECDVALETPPGRTSPARRLLCRLLGEHLGCGEQRFGRALERRGSLIAAVEGFGGTGGRALRTLELGPGAPPWLDEVLGDASVADPDRPLTFESFAEDIVPEQVRQGREEPLVRRLALWGIVAAVFLIWRWTPLEPLIPIQSLMDAAAGALSPALSLAVVLALYLLLALVPPGLLVLLTVLLFGAGEGLLYAFVGLSGSALAFYGLGRALGRRRGEDLIGASIDRLGQRIAAASIGAVARARLSSLAPFATVNLASGAHGVPLPRFLLTAVLGLVPVVVLGVGFGAQLRHTIVEFDLVNMLALAALFGLMVGFVAWLRSRLSPRRYRPLMDQAR